MGDVNCMGAACMQRRCSSLTTHSRSPRWTCRRHCDNALVHRYYDPATSQFLSVDPLVAATGTPYAYTGGDPVNASDPTGLCGGIFGCLGAALSWTAHQVGAFGNGIASGFLGNGSSWCNNQEGPQRAFACSGGVAVGEVAPFVAALFGSAYGYDQAGDTADADAAGCAQALESAPANVQSTFAYIQEHGEAPADYAGGGTFENREGLLPSEDAAGNPVSYRKYDVNPYSKAVNRGTERIVVGSNGAAYYTTNHYGSFIRIQ